MAKCSSGFAFLIMVVLLGCLSLISVGLKVTMISKCLKTELSKEELAKKNTGTTGSLWIVSPFFFNRECWRKKIWTTLGCGHISFINTVIYDVLSLFKYAILNILNQNLDQALK